ncbi:hypothetical protein GCM10009612_42790 [Streptomyces beijiangensis]
MLPGRRGDGDGHTAGDGDGEQELAVLGVTDRTPQAEPGDGGCQREEGGDLQRPVHSEAQQRAVQGLVGEARGLGAEARSCHMVDPVRPRVARHHGPGQRRTGDEGGRGGDGGAPAAGQPEKGYEEEHGRLKRRREPDQEP